MQTVALKPKRAEWMAMLIGLVMLSGAMFAVPALCVPLAVLAPLLACPLVGRKEEPAAWVSAAVPMMASLAAGCHPYYAVSLVLIGALPLLVTRLVPAKKRPGAVGILLYISAMAFSLIVVLTAASSMLGSPLYRSLAQVFVNWVGLSENRQLLLRQLAMNGLISIPGEYASQNALRPLMEAALEQQMLMSLRLTMERIFAQYLPSLVVQSCIVTGLFISLRLERVSGVLLVVETRHGSDKHTRVIAPPSFRLLAVPRTVYTVMLALAVTAFLAMTSPGSFVHTVGQLCYAAFQTVFCLLGAAVLVFMYTRNDPERKTMAGVLTALIYVMAPFVLLVIGIMDQRFHFRKPQAQKPDEK